MIFSQIPSGQEFITINEWRSTRRSFSHVGCDTARDNILSVDPLREINLGVYIYTRQHTLSIILPDQLYTRFIKLCNHYVIWKTFSRNVLYIRFYHTCIYHKYTDFMTPSYRGDVKPQTDVYPERFKIYEQTLLHSLVAGLFSTHLKKLK